jgi:hypothetical protein
LAWFSFSPFHWLVVEERYHAFHFQATWPDFALPCAVILIKVAERYFYAANESISDQIPRSSLFDPLGSEWMQGR